MKLAYLLLALAAIAGCTGPAATPIIIYVTPPPATEPPTVTPSPAVAEPTNLPTATPPQPRVTVALPTPTRRPTATPAGVANAEKGEPIMLTWSSDDYVTAQVLLSVTNIGDTWIQLDEFDSNFTIYDTDRSVVETRSFDAAAPKFLAPTGTSYLVGEVFTDEHPLSAYDTVTADGYFEEIDGPPSILTVENTRVRRGSFDGVEATGEVLNMGDEGVDNADVVAIFFDAGGAVLGYARGFVENIEPGGRRAFEVSSDFAEIRLSDIAESQFFASAWAF